MAFVSVHCPACGEENEIDSNQEFFFCVHCSKKAITQAAISYSIPEENSRIEDPSLLLPPPITTTGEEGSYLKRIFLFLEEGDWARADAYCEVVLNYNPESSLAYLGKLMSRLRLRKKEDLSKQAKSYEGEYEWRFALRFADESLKQELEAYSADCARYLAFLDDRAKLDAKAKAERKAKAKSKAKAEAKKERTYVQALSLMQESTSTSNYLEALDLLRSISDYEQSEHYIEQAESFLYERAQILKNGFTEESLKSAFEIYEQLGSYKDSAKQADQLRKHF